MNDTQWGPGQVHHAIGKVTGEDGQVLNDCPTICTSYWLHAYTHPVIALLLNRVHGDFNDPHLWRCRGIVKAVSLDKKVGCSTLETVDRMTLPRIMLQTRVCFALNCVAKVYKDPGYIGWAKNWIAGKERISSVDRVVSKFLKDKLELCRNDRGPEPLTVQAAHAAVEAVVSLGSIQSTKGGIKTVEFMAASAAVYANRAAYEMKEKFDLIDVAERTMAAQ